MTYKSHVENGVIVMDEPVELREGMEVAVDLGEDRDACHQPQSLSFSQRYAAIIGKAEGLPEDAAENHDHYLYGTPKSGSADLRPSL